MGTPALPPIQLSTIQLAPAMPVHARASKFGRSPSSHQNAETRRCIVTSSRWFSSILDAYLVIRINRVIEVVALETGEARFRGHSACHWLREAQCPQTCASWLGHRRRHATKHRKSIHQRSELIVGEILLERGLAMNIGDHPRTVAP